AHEIRTRGIGFQEAAWPAHQIMRYVAGEANGATVFSDNPYLIYHAIGLPTFELPAKFDRVTSRPNAEFETEMKQLVELGRRRKVIAVLFESEWQDGPFPTNHDLTDRWGFRPILTASNTVPGVCGEGFQCWSKETYVLQPESVSEGAVDK